MVEFTEMDGKPAATVDCMKCEQAGTLVHPNPTSAAAAWNRRAAPPDSLAERLAEALREYLACGVEYDAGRYLVVQVPHVTREQARAALAAFDARRKHG
jgi:hypothetical protein